MAFYVLLVAACLLFPSA